MESEAAFDRMATLARYAPLQHSNFSYYAEADNSVIDRVTCGVLFLAAFWSGPSLMAFRELSKVLTTLDPGGRLEFIVVDIDGCPALYDRPELYGRISGAGETVWIKDGCIICTSGQGFHPESFEPNTKLLMATIA